MKNDTENEPEILNLCNNMDGGACPFRKEDRCKLPEQCEVEE
jgi:hypothetical protein